MEKQLEYNVTCFYSLSFFFLSSSSSYNTINTYRAFEGQSCIIIPFSLLCFFYLLSKQKDTFFFLSRSHYLIVKKKNAREKQNLIRHFKWTIRVKRCKSIQCDQTLNLTRRSMNENVYKRERERVMFRCTRVPTYICTCNVIFFFFFFVRLYSLISKAGYYQERENGEKKKKDDDL